MATTGKSAWEKYYQGRGDIDTIIKKQSEIYDPKITNKVIGSIPAGTKVIVLETRQHESKPVVTYRKGKQTYKVRVKFDNLQKPGVASRTVKSNSRTIANKALTPNELGLGGKTIPKNKFKAVVKSAIDSCKVVAPHVKKFLHDFIEKSESSTMRLNESVTQINDADIKVIEKDFGEIAGAWWFINNYDTNLDRVEFPDQIATPLVDYYVYYKNGIKLKISAKAREGAAPSISNVYKMIENNRFTGKDLQVKKFIAEIVNNSGREGIVASAKLFKSDGYKIISKLMKDDNLTDEKIETWLATFKSPSSIDKYLQDNYYSQIGRSASQPIIQRIYSSGARKSGIVTSPMAYALVDEVNKNKSYIDFLTRACNSESIQQLYVEINKNTKAISYTVKEFKDSQFEFEYHSNAGDPGANKIGFKLVK